MAWSERQPCLRRESNIVLGTDNTVNPSVSDMLRGSVAQGEGLLTPFEGLVVSTGKYTGRSPNDKSFIDEDPTLPNHLDSLRNRTFARKQYDRLVRKVNEYLTQTPMVVQHLYAGADPRYGLSLEVATDTYWQALFARNLFRKPGEADLPNFKPDWTVVDVSRFKAKSELDGTRSETFIFIDTQRNLVLIGGTEYAGEIKKGVFTVLNYLLPNQGVFPAHCSSNATEDRRVSLFFGLSGTGKTTLSADPNRRLIGDDEHGWSDRGVFNFEGGCYAKVINLDPRAEPDIYQAVHSRGTILENVVYDPRTGVINFASNRITENTRAAYPSESVPNMDAEGLAGHPEQIFFLSADAFGVLPPIARLSPEQAMEYFLAGYTAKLAGTERGVTAPEATFSAAFGQPFLVHRPEVYAKMLAEKICQFGSEVWLVNTGWTGGPYGIGSRMRIDQTRALIRAAQDGLLDGVPYSQDPIFGLSIPTSCPDVDPSILDPRNTWEDREAYDRQATNLRNRFRENLGQYSTN